MAFSKFLLLLGTAALSSNKFNKAHSYELEETGEERRKKIPNDVALKKLILPCKTSSFYETSFSPQIGNDWSFCKHLIVQIWKTYL